MATTSLFLPTDHLAASQWLALLHVHGSGTLHRHSTPDPIRKTHRLSVTGESVIGTGWLAATD